MSSEADLLAPEPSQLAAVAFIRAALAHDPPEQRERLLVAMATVLGSLGNRLLVETEKPVSDPGSAANLLERTKECFYNWPTSPTMVQVVLELDSRAHFNPLDASVALGVTTELSESASVIEGTPPAFALTPGQPCGSRVTLTGWSPPESSASSSTPNDVTLLSIRFQIMAEPQDWLVMGMASGTTVLALQTRTSSAKETPAPSNDESPSKTPSCEFSVTLVPLRLGVLALPRFLIQVEAMPELGGPPAPTVEVAHEYSFHHVNVLPNPVNGYHLSRYI
ncbi:hypothetical protein BJ085DRAFT_32761 [Dimargaris cristalligena]|uniref:TRAPPC10/Trs130 C-terminal domain-containing protein n=1 Tax=Dimargaris cristalligena TaxID=215637 RepID=A0A4P9ZL67_9FUNG|nr:hypothetical protein BJ085DRAFT_32761 [Dimargaris cristalligena]|eukprot:RKP33322.1 hypothetical protein BJ085DRAFT_32761 [Dimargaris cristalligena]